MGEYLSWESVYELWKLAGTRFDGALDSAPEVQVVPVDLNDPDYVIRGYDWIPNATADERAYLAMNRVGEWLLSEPTSIKGTMHTAELLNQAHTEEDRAAIWIAATAFELKDTYCTVGKCRADFELAALDHLRGRYELWHYATRRRVPEIFIWSLLKYERNDLEPRQLMAMIVINTMLLKQNYRMLYYTSEGESAAHETLG